MTLEEAQARILELVEQNQALTAERDSLSQNNNELTAERDSLRELNQKYFNKLIAQEVHEDKTDPEPPPVSCEEFAKTLNI